MHRMSNCQTVKLIKVLRSQRMNTIMQLVYMQRGYSATYRVGRQGRTSLMPPRLVFAMSDAV